MWRNSLACHVRPHGKVKNVFTLSAVACLLRCSTFCSVSGRKQKCILKAKTKTQQLFKCWPCFGFGEDGNDDDIEIGQWQWITKMYWEILSKRRLFPGDASPNSLPHSVMPTMTWMMMTMMTTMHCNGENYDFDDFPTDFECKVDFDFFLCRNKQI